MVSPIDYTMNVLNPLEGYMQGLKFGEGILTARQGRELAQSQESRAQEKFALAKEDRARAIQQQQAAAAQAQAQREQAERGQQALLEYLDNLEAGTATASDLRRAMVQFPQVSERFQAVASSFSQEKLANETQFGQQLAFALGRGNTDAAQSLIQERLDAATASGDERGAAAYQSQLKMLETSPEALLTETLMPLISTMPVDDFDKFYDLAVGGKAPDQPAEVRELQFRAEQGGLVPGTPEYQEFMRTGGASLGGNFRVASPEEAAQYGATAGQIDTSSGRFYPIQPPSGMSIETGPDGTTRIVQGPGVTSKPFTEGQSKDVVYATRARGALDEFEPVANKLTSRGERLLEIVPLGFGRDYQDPDYQVAQRAGTEFLQAILRKDTGATITEAEQMEYGRVYLPQPGDSQEVLKSRAAARKRAVAALQVGMSPEQMLAVERAFGLAPETTATSSAPRLQFDADGNLIP